MGLRILCFMDAAPLPIIPYFSELQIELAPNSARFVRADFLGTTSDFENRRARSVPKEHGTDRPLQNRTALRPLVL